MKNNHRDRKKKNYALKSKRVHSYKCVSPIKNVFNEMNYISPKANTFEARVEAYQTSRFNRNEKYANYPSGQICLIPDFEYLRMKHRSQSCPDISKELMKERERIRLQNERRNQNHQMRNQNNQRQLQRSQSFRNNENFQNKFRSKSLKCCRVLFH